LVVTVSIPAQSSQRNELFQLENNFRETIVFNDNVEAELTNKELQMITEVFGDQTQTLVLNNPTYLQDLKNLLRNRITVFKVEEASKQKQTNLLSEIPLSSMYGQTLTRDTVFDEATFNPLKYQLEFFSNGTFLYRVDHTDYFIKVTSQYRK